MKMTTKILIEIKQEVEIDRNSDEGHSVDATLTLTYNGYEIGTAHVRHQGLSPWGEAFFYDVTFDGIPEWLQDDASKVVKNAASDEIQKWWNYNGSQWSEPVDEPEDEMLNEPDEEHQWAVVSTAFHGKGVKGYAVSEESAEAWVAKLVAGTDCICGCYGVVAVADLDKLPTNDGNQHDPYSLMR